MIYTEATTHVDTGRLVWDSDGYYVVGSDNWKDIIATANIIYQGGEIGLIPRFDSDLTYVAFVLSTNDATGTVNDVSITGEVTTTASLFAQISSDTIYLAETKLDADLITGQSYEIKIEIKRTNYRVYLDGVMIFNVEYNGLNNGSVAFYGTTGTEATSIEVQSDFPDGWTTNVDTISSAIVDIQQLENDDKYIYMNNPSATELYIEQTIDIQSGLNTLSFESKGAVKSRVSEQDGASPQIFSSTYTSDDWMFHAHTFQISADCTQVKVRLYMDTIGEASFNDVQLEPLQFNTSYIHNNSTTESISRGDSFITYPSKDNINADNGSISLWFKPSVDYASLTSSMPCLFEYGNTDESITLELSDTSIHYTYGNNTWTLPVTITVNEWHHVVVTWNSDKLSLTFNGTYQESLGMYSFSGSSDVIRIGHSANGLEVFNGIIDDLIIFSKPVDQDYITELYAAEDPVSNREDMVLRATFDYAIGSFNKSVIEISPAPGYGSPVIARKADGTPMQKVSFFDPTSGEFKTYNTERHVYDGTSDYIRVGYKDIDATSFVITMKNQDGQLIGSPYSVEGDKIYFTLGDEEKKDLRGTTLDVTYQPENPYTVDFNIGQPDSFRVSIGKHDGQDVSIDYEGNQMSEEKLATMIELNPLLNPNHKGFMYIVQQPNNISTFRAKASPSDLPADGISEAVIVIEPLDTNGNFVSYAKLEVTAKYGHVIPNYDEGSVRMRETAGRYMYKYRAPLMTYSEQNAVELMDSVNVVDTVSGLGVQVPVSLVLMDSYYAGDMSKTGEESTWEMIAAYILGKVTDNIGKQASDLPSGLGDVLDFNGDGVIDIKEIIWLNNYKFSQDLYNKYLDVLSWYQANE